MSSRAAPFAARLLRWFDGQRRDLPWRRTRDPWAIWISEVMLQQTRVEVVRQVFPRFVRRYPTPRALADASDDELLSSWRGLGYYRRARLLREAARALVAEHGGSVPRDPDALEALPGVGTYTRGALASIAFDLPEVAIDGNVKRVAARHRGIDASLERREGLAAVRAAAEEWLHRERPGDFNQALMELGATVCTPRAPRCGACPVREDCRARAEGRTEALPRGKERRSAVEVHARAVLVPVRGGRVLATRVPEQHVNSGQIDLPGPGPLVDVRDAAALQEWLGQRFKVEFSVGTVVCTVRHAITCHRVILRVHEARCARGPGPDLMAVRPDDRRLPWTTAARKAFAQAALFLAAGRGSAG